MRQAPSMRLLTYASEAPSTKPDVFTAIRQVPDRMRKASAPGTTGGVKVQQSKPTNHRVKTNHHHQHLHMAHRHPSRSFGLEVVDRLETRSLVPSCAVVPFASILSTAVLCLLASPKFQTKSYRDCVEEHAVWSAEGGEDGGNISTGFPQKVSLG
ncbi:MIP family channel protein [Anopheles sinensis]|uniref:MIP family channel protein n=1 Tax=Anopheles sinensis TaxID=74873 RepID=A0A084VQ59_ANOSI|nr:MIP family channel protein [Anopheles sinensis]